MRFFLAVAIAVLGVPNPHPTPASTPFCTVLEKRVAPVVLAEARDNEAIAKIFPALFQYQRSLSDHKPELTSLGLYRLRKILAQLQTDQPALQRALKGQLAAKTPDLDEHELLVQTGIGLNSVMAEQQSIMRSLKAFVDEALFQEDVGEGHRIQVATQAENTTAAAADARSGSALGQLTTAAASDNMARLSGMPYLEPIVAGSRQIIDEEQYLHNLMGLSIARCAIRRQAAKPTPTPR